MPHDAPKQAPKKAPAPRHKAAGDARRTFEHMGRMQALAPLTTAESSALTLLSSVADAEFRAGRYKQSADLLRAAEHVSFAALHAQSRETVAQDLERAILNEFRHLTERMHHHAASHSAPGSLQQLRGRLHADAEAALGRGSWRAALELARAGEALAHIHDPAAPALPSPAARKRLRP